MIFKWVSMPIENKKAKRLLHVDAEAFYFLLYNMAGESKKEHHV